MKRRHDIFKAIADPTRRRILAMLAASGSLSITAISGGFSSARQVVARHIHILESAGLVSITDVGRERYCVVRPEPIREVYDWAAFYEKFWDEKLPALQRHLKKTSKKNTK
jgi:DNA-binding transcriptional ArsR family regulator